jgi:septum formation topological specificity factor MinE
MPTTIAGVTTRPDKVQIKLDRGKSVSTLKVDIEIPNGLDAALVKAS